MNNPLKYTDKSGKFWEFIIGAGISVITNGFQNLANGKSFFDGAGRAAIMGAIGGGFSSGIGNAVGEFAAFHVSAFGQVAFQTIGHGILGGAMSVADGGGYGSGFLSAAVSSLAASGTGALLKKVGAEAQSVGMFASGTVSGGLASVAAGGSFWDGARNGAISAGLNHVAHLIETSIQKGRYHEFSGKKIATGHLIGADIESNEYSGVSTITFQDAKYALLARYDVKQTGAHTWSVSASAYYIGPDVDNLQFNASTYVSGQRGSSQELNTTGERVYVPQGWTYIGSAGYDFTDNAGSFNVGVNVSVRTYTFAGNQPGTGYIKLIIPIRKN